MNKTRMISFRIDEDVLADIDALANIHTYWTRSRICIKLLTAIFKFCDASTKFQILKSAAYNSGRFKITIEELDKKED